MSLVSDLNAKDMQNISYGGGGQVFFGAYGRFGAGLISMQINTGLYFFEFAWLIFLYAMYIK